MSHGQSATVSVPLLRIPQTMCYIDMVDVIVMIHWLMLVCQCLLCSFNVKTYDIPNLNVANLCMFIVREQQIIVCFDRTSNT